MELSMSIQITDTTSALVYLGLVIVGILGSALVGWVLISAGITAIAWWRGQDWRQAWRDQMAEW
jgi:hypothetical protein